MKSARIQCGLLLLAFLLTLGAGCSRDAKPSFTTANTAFYEKRAMADMAEYTASAIELQEAGYFAPVPAPANADFLFGRDGGRAYGEMPAAPEPAGAGNATERKLAMRANVSIRVENLDAADSSITGLMKKYDAYAAMTEVMENRRYYSLRVPSPEYALFLAEVDGMGRPLSRSESAEDVTLRFYDLEGRLASQRELLATYQSYLKQAKNIEEILSVEARINQLQNELDGTGRELRNLSNRIDYATVDLTVLGPLASAPNRGLTLGEKIGGLFRGFGNFLSTALVALIGIVIFGIPVLLLLIFFYWILFGKVGLLKKIWRIAAGKKRE